MTKEVKALKEAARKFAPAATLTKSQARRAATTHDVIAAVFASKTSPAFNDRAAALAALEDGQALAALGFTDADRVAVECAHAALRRECHYVISEELQKARETLPEVCITAADWLAAEGADDDYLLDFVYTVAGNEVPVMPHVLNRWHYDCNESWDYCNELMRNDYFRTPEAFDMFRLLQAAWERKAAGDIHEKIDEVYAVALVTLLKPLHYICDSEMPESLVDDIEEMQTIGDFRKYAAELLASIEEEREEA